LTKANKSTKLKNKNYDFEFNVDGSIFANQELLKHTTDNGVTKSDNLTHNISEHTSKGKQTIPSFDNQYINNSGRTIDSQDIRGNMNPTFGVINSKRKSFEKVPHSKQSLLPMLLKYKQDGKNVDLTKLKVYSYKKMGTIKSLDTSPEKARVYTQGDSFSKDKSLIRNTNKLDQKTIEGDDREDQITKTVRETMELFNLNDISDNEIVTNHN